MFTLPLMPRISSVVTAACALLAGSAVPLAAQAPATAHPGYTIPGSQLRTLAAKAAGRPQYRLYVGLPASYEKEPGRKYPVVYVTDGYWDFQKITAIQGGLVYDKVAPEFITVGLGYAGDNLNYGDLRRWDLSPVSFGEAATSGHAKDFLEFIGKEVIPFIEREYRADPSYRVLAGASLGGLFTLYSMYTQPQLFQAYVAATPAVILGNDWLLGYDDTFAKSAKPLNARLYVTGGGNESPGFLGGILRYNQRISSRKYQGLQYEFRVIDGERHAAMQFESYVRGLRFAFAPLAPETGPASAP